MDVAGIYLLCNVVNGKCYVGQSVNISRRWREHLKAMRSNHKSHLYDAMRKHGAENFMLVVLEECGPEQADAREAFWMAHFDCHANGYNYRPAGKLTQTLTPEARASISNRLRGKKMSPERIEQMRQTSTGKPCSESAKAKLREFHSGIVLDEATANQIKAEVTATLPEKASRVKRVVNTDYSQTEQFRKQCSERFKGKPKSDETRKRMSEAQKNRNPEDETRRRAVLSAVTKARWAKYRADKEQSCLA